MDNLASERSRFTHLDGRIRVFSEHCDLTVIQVSNVIGRHSEPFDPEGIAAEVIVRAFLYAELEGLGDAEDWVAFIASPRPHWQDLTCWICLSTNIAPEVVSYIETVIANLGSSFEVQDMHSSECELAPVAFKGRDGCELLFPEGMIPQTGLAEELVDRVGGTVVIREVRVSW